MKRITVGEILSVCVSNDAVCTNHVDQDCIAFSFGSRRDEIRFFLFEDLGVDRLAWCEQALEEHVRDVIGPPFLTSVIPVEGDTWQGFQAATVLEEQKCVVNRMIASKVSDCGARIEFRASKGVALEKVTEVVESVCFMTGEYQADIV